MGWPRIARGCALAVAIGVGLALRWTTPDAAQDLRPRPDALEYEEAARNLVRGRGYHVVVDGERYVPRYPFGFSLLLAPVLAVWDAGPGTGVVVVLATAAGAVGGAWALGARTGGLAGAIVAAGVVALSPAHVRWSQAVMADVPSSCGIAWVTLAVLAALRSRRGAGVWAAIGVTIGLLATVRLSNAFVAAPIAVLVATRTDVPARARAGHLGGLALGALGGIAPLLAYQTLHLGGPLRTGYDVWVPVAKFSWRHLFNASPVGGGTHPNVVFYLAVLAGLGRLYDVAVAALLALGTIVAARAGGDARRILVLALGFVGLLLCFHGPFFWQDTRFLVPALPLLAAVAATPLAARAAPGVRAAALALAVLAAGRLAIGPTPWMRDTVFHEPSVLQEYSRRVEPDAAVLVNSNDHYVSLFLAAPDRLWVPLGLDDHRLTVRWHRIPPAIADPAARAAVDQAFAGRFHADAAAQALERLVASGRPVYLSTLLGFQVPFLGELGRIATSRFRVERVAVIHGTELLRLHPR